MFSKGGMDNLIKQAKQMQKKCSACNKITINVTHNYLRVEIDPSLLEDDKDMLEDLNATAFNDGAHCVAEPQKEKIAAISSGIQLLPRFKISF